MGFITNLQVFCLSLEATATCNLHADHLFPLAVWFDLGLGAVEVHFLILWETMAT
jgi:hypothetical protein